MLYVIRDASGAIESICREPLAGATELAPDSPELAQFLQAGGEVGHQLDATDLGFIRVVEDLVELLVEKGVILFTELPASAQQKMLYRQTLRSGMRNQLNLLGED
ncbi:MAG: hypothetical protein ACK5HY_08450 [Parahaliea sp.]